MKIGFLNTPDDQRCPVSVKTIKKYVDKGAQIFIEHGTSDSISEDFSFAEGVEITDRASIISGADIIYSNNPMTEDEVKSAKSGAMVISSYNKFKPDDVIYEGTHDIQVFSLDMIPRTTLAQSMDVLSSMASIAGYKAVLLAADKLPRYFPMMMTAAGTIKPSTVLILGAGVAGLQAIATSRKLGARVEAFDVRKAVKEEVQSLGAKFVEVEGSKDDKDAGGYAVEQTEEYKRKQKEKIHERAANADVIITTAQLRGRPAPILITKEMVEDMKFGSVIIDMASSTGGNCELTQDEKEINHNGITIIGNSYLFNKAMIDASELLANNIHDFIATFLKEGNIDIDMENEIISGSKIYPK
ncbi:MAG: NAD(P) transhydrogenase subunit alpha [Saprospiraceae bacterium]|nr:NAD(P) transhydrogenase subunit alpha [Saprospiraceae bacterium]